MGRLPNELAPHVPSIDATLQRPETIDDLCQSIDGTPNALSGFLFPSSPMPVDVVDHSLQVATYGIQSGSSNRRGGWLRGSIGTTLLPSLDFLVESPKMGDGNIIIPIELVILCF